MAVKFGMRLFLLWPAWTESCLIDGLNLGGQLHFVQAVEPPEGAASSGHGAATAGAGAAPATGELAGGAGVGAATADGAVPRPAAPPLPRLSSAHPRLLVLAHGFCPDAGPGYTFLSVLRVAVCRVPGWAVVVPDFRPTYEPFWGPRARAERTRILVEELLVATAEVRAPRIVWNVCTRLAALPGGCLFGGCGGGVPGSP
jgi:hypothetical protein